MVIFLGEQIPDGSSRKFIVADLNYNPPKLWGFIRPKFSADVFLGGCRKFLTKQIFHWLNWRRKKCVCRYIDFFGFHGLNFLKLQIMLGGNILDISHRTSITTRRRLGCGVRMCLYPRRRAVRKDRPHRHPARGSDVHGEPSLSAQCSVLFV